MAFVTALLVGACDEGGPTEVVDAGPFAASSDDGASAPVQVFLTTILLSVPRDQLGTLGEHTPTELAARTDGSVLGAPNILLDTDRVTRVEVPADDADAEDTRYEYVVAPQVREDGRIRLAVEVSSSADAQPMRTTLELGDAQTAILPTSLSAPPGEALVLVVQAETVRSRASLERIADRKRALR